MIVLGFEGQLQGWWEGYIDQGQRNQIINAIKIKEEPIE